MSAPTATTKVLHNIRSGDLAKTIDAYKAQGWTLHSFAPVSGPGLVGVTFTAIFERSDK